MPQFSVRSSQAAAAVRQRGALVDGGDEERCERGGEACHAQSVPKVRGSNPGSFIVRLLVLVILKYDKVSRRVCLL